MKFDSVVGQFGSVVGQYGEYIDCCWPGPLWMTKNWELCCYNGLYLIRYEWSKMNLNQWIRELESSIPSDQLDWNNIYAPLNIPQTLDHISHALWNAQLSTGYTYYNNCRLYPMFWIQCIDTNAGLKTPVNNIFISALWEWRNLNIQSSR